MATPHVVMYCTAICPYCIRAEQLLKRKGIAEIEKVRIDLVQRRQSGHGHDGSGRQRGRRLEGGGDAAALL